jgi:hypothetical protein
MAGGLRRRWRQSPCRRDQEPGPVAAEPGRLPRSCHRRPCGSARPTRRSVASGNISGPVSSAVSIAPLMLFFSLTHPLHSRITADHTECRDSPQTSRLPRCSPVRADLPHATAVARPPAPPTPKNGSSKLTGWCNGRLRCVSPPPAPRPTAGTTATTAHAAGPAQLRLRAGSAA